MDKKEILRYLNYKNQILDEKTKIYLNESIEEVEKYSNIRYTYKIYKIKSISEEIIQLENSEIQLKGKSINKLLINCNKVIIFAATLGINIDKKIKYLEKINLAKGIIFNTTSSVYIDEICDEIEKELKLKYKSHIFTRRYSPGYGDLKLNIQHDILKELNASKSCGIYTDEYNNLIPIKTITALIGIKKI